MDPYKQKGNYEHVQTPIDVYIYIYIIMSMHQYDYKNVLDMF